MAKMIWTIICNFHGSLTYREHEIPEELKDIHSIVFDNLDRLTQINDRINIRKDYASIKNDASKAFKSYKKEILNEQA